MGLKVQNGHPYYYHNIKRGNRVVTKYLGSGTDAIEACLAAQQEREAVKQARAKAKEAEIECEQAHDSLDRDLDLMVLHAQSQAAKVLGGSGFHLHRGSLRRRRSCHSFR